MRQVLPLFCAIIGLAGCADENLTNPLAHPDASRPAFSADPVTTQAASGQNFNCVLRDTGVINCWGSGPSSLTPAIKVAASGSFTQLTAGGFHACALRTDGVVECWGWGDSGQAPLTKTAATGTFVQVDAGYEHNCAVRSDGVIECWGHNGKGQAPETRTATTSGGFTKVAAGGRHTCALRTDTFVECWGQNTEGQAPGLNLSSYSSYTDLESGYFHSCGVASGQVHCWGDNSNLSAPETRVAATGTFVTVVGGLYHSCGLRTDAEIECWGTVSSTGSTSYIPGAYTQVTTKGTHTCAVRSSDALVHCFGHVPHGVANRSEQRIAFTGSPPEPANGGSVYTVGTSNTPYGLPSVIRSLTRDICTPIGGNEIFLIAAGTCTITASDAGDVARLPAPPITQTFTVTGNAPLPVAPTGFTANAASATQIDLTWTDASDNETRFLLKRRLYTTAWESWLLVGYVSAGTTSYSDTGLTGNTKYQYRIRACHPGGCSERVTSARVTTP